MDARWLWVELKLGNGQFQTIWAGSSPFRSMIIMADDRRCLLGFLKPHKHPVGFQHFPVIDLMDADTIERLTKGLDTQKKRNEKISSESSKRVKVSASAPVAPATTDAILEVRSRDEVIPTISITCVDAAEGGSLPFESENLKFGDHAPEPFANKEKEKKKKK
ncbi:hypothetical protein COCNU_09G001580 [Cocos nucifera]|uniref:Uncharacterized protein n=1 Tax=Cocos nucifera TaxID=13894 RepID=A0A8K0IJD3_COCNU|nr:hypothetical protein COCNU_09G001580 [Cocos nucifera]